MKYKKLWTDMHSNLHHEKMDQLPKWFDHIRQLVDFWPFAYYPFYMKATTYGLGVEDRYEDAVIERDWEYIREFTNQVNQEGYPMFMGYEWQGSGLDGDHNVFFLDNNQYQKHPYRYQDLVAAHKGVDAIGIPHHVAYQLGSRGKNWETHDETFSPLAEIYSSHGCSENDDGPLSMTRHIHMGPRTGETAYEVGLNRGYRVGVIASGDNHGVPCVFEHGSMCVLAEDNTKEAIWDAMIHRRTYGVSQSRMELDFNIDGASMGEEVTVSDSAQLSFFVKGTSAVDRVEILRDNILDEMVVHSGTWEKKPWEGVIRFKFRVEFGWGPDTRIYKDMMTRNWRGRLETEGKLLGVEKCWNNFGQEFTSVDENGCEFSLTTYQSTATGKWMGPSNVTTEGFIFEVEADVDSTIHLWVDGTDYPMKVRDMLKTSKVTALWDEVKQLTQERWGDIAHYRNDPWWHNAYKFKVGKACPSESYEVHFNKKISVEQDCSIRLRVWQKNNDAAWTSPIFIYKK